MEQRRPPLRFEPTRLVPRLAAFACGTALAVMLPGGGPARAAGFAEPLRIPRDVLSYDLAAASSVDSTAKAPGGIRAEWSPRVAYWTAHHARRPTVWRTLGGAVDRRPIRYRLDVTRNRVDLWLTRPF